MDVFKMAQYNQAIAWEIVKNANIAGIWESIGAEVNLVGSLKSGLLLKNRDIDFHIYSKNLILAESFLAIEKLAENRAVKEITFRNLIETEEECIEWHAWYEDNNKNLWQLDMIHIRKGSAYDGVVERMTDLVIEKLTDETREAILRIKYDTPDDIKVLGAEIYHAVIYYNVRNYREFSEWMKNRPDINILGLYMK